MSPLVGKVVLVVKAISVVNEELVDGTLAFVDCERVIEFVGRVSECFVFESKLVEVAVAPAHDDLDDPMDPSKMRVGWYYEAAPYR